MKTSIICTGRSLYGFDFNSIDTHIIAVNKAHQYLENYDMLVALDNPFKFGFPTEKLHTQIHWGVGTPYSRIWETKLVRDKGFIGSNGYSVFTAIEIALQHGFKEIDIYGAEMMLLGGYCHFYDDEPLTDDLKHIYNREFTRQRLIKALFMEQLLDDEVVNWIEDPKNYILD
jgi:hypothetical protein